MKYAIFKVISMENVERKSNQRDYSNIDFSRKKVKQEIRNQINRRIKSLLLPSKDKDFINELHLSAKYILPNYQPSSLLSLLQSLKRINGKAIEEIIVSLINENKESSLYQIYNNQLSKEEAFNAFDDALYSYHGNPDFNKEYIPSWLKDISYYNNNTGILDVKGDVRAYIYDKDNILTIAFTGTQTSTRIESVVADIIQLFDESYLYALSSGLVHLALTKSNYNKIKVIGHSLGGGLCQFSLLTNHNKKLEGICFNSAGLSKITLETIEQSSIDGAKQQLQHFITKNDIVSKFGAIIGHVVFLPEVGESMHSLESLKPCLEAYYDIT